jgi:hypothetical protein
VSLGLIGQLELDALVKKAADKKTKDDAKRAAAEPAGESLAPLEEARGGA